MSQQNDSARGRGPARGHAAAILLVCVIVGLCLACAPSEDEIRREVRTRLSADRATATLALSVEVKGRVVYLSGRTSTPAEQEQAMSLARAVSGVKLVVNDMWLNNTALAGKVKSALAADSMLSTVPIEVEAEGTLVRLWSDRTNREERERAVRVAQAVEGVGQVEDRMK